MKNKTIIAGAVILATATGTTAFADETSASNSQIETVSKTTENNNPIAKAEKETTQIQKELSNAEDSAKETFTKEEVAKTEYVEASNAVQNTQNEIQKINEDLNNKKDHLDKNLTSIPKLENELKDTKENVSKLEEQITNTKAELNINKEKQKKEEAKIQPQVDNLTQATSNKENAQYEVDTIKEDLKNNQEKETVLTKEINDLTSAKEVANKNLTNAKELLNNAKKADETLSKNISTQETIVEKEEKEKAEAIRVENEKKSRKDNLNKELQKAKKSLADNVEITVPSSYVFALQAYQADQNKENNDALVRISKEVLASDKIKETTKLLKESDTRKVDVSNLTTEQLKELNIRMAQFIEDVRSEFATYVPTMVKVSEESVNMSKLIGETYKNAIRKSANSSTPTMWDAFKLGHLNGNVTVGANIEKAGYKSSKIAPTRLETLAYTSETDYQTMGDLKALLYKQMIGWLYEDEDSNWGHALIQSGLTWSDYETELHTYVVKDGEYVMVGVTETNFKTQDSSLTTKEYETPETDYYSASSEVTRLEKEIQKNQTDLEKASENVLTTTSKLSTSITKLEKLKLTKLLTPKAEEDYNAADKEFNELSNQLSEKNKNLKSVRDLLKELEEVLPLAENDLAIAIVNYNKAKLDYDKVSINVEKAKLEVATIEKKIKELEKTLEKEQTEIDNIQEAIIKTNKEITETTKLIKVLEEQLKEKKTKLEEVVKNQKEKESIYLAIKNVADKEREKINNLKSKYEKALAHLNNLKLEKSISERKEKELELYNKMIDGEFKKLSDQKHNSNQIKNSIPRTGARKKSLFTVITSVVVSVIAVITLILSKK